MRLHKPIGILLLLWPTLWALWLASRGQLSLKLLVIFILGVIVMRSAGCVINDIVDRKIDKHVTRTRERPITSGKITVQNALLLFSLLMLIALTLLSFLNRMSIWLGLLGAAFTLFYPFLKRITYLPQVGLGVTFAWGVPMAFAAQNNSLAAIDWLVFLTAMVWIIMFDTLYAMADREDDLAIQVKSMAILFGKQDRLLIGCLQISIILLLMLIGKIFSLKIYYFLAVIGSGGLFIYQQWLISNRKSAACYQAFVNNHWVGLLIFLGIVA